MDVRTIFPKYFLSSLLGALSFGASGQMRQSRGAFIPRAPWTMGLSIFHPQTFVHMSSLD